MMKSYLRYEPKSQFGVIASPQCNVQYDYTGNLAFTGAIQEVCVWNLRQATQVGMAVAYSGLELIILLFLWLVGCID